MNQLQAADVDDTVYREQFESDLPLPRPTPSQFRIYNGHGHLYDDSSAPSLHEKNREIGAEKVKIKVSMPFTVYCILSRHFKLIL